MRNKNSARTARERGSLLQLILSVLFLVGFAVTAFFPYLPGMQKTTLFDLIKILLQEGTQQTLTGYAAGAMLGFYALTVILTVFSIFAKKKKTGLVLNYLKAVSAVLVFGFLAVAFRWDGIANFQILFSSVNSAALSLYWAALNVILLNFITYRSYGIVKLLLTAVAFAFFGLYRFKMVADYKLLDLFTLNLSLGETTAQTIAGYAYTALAFGIALNAIVSVFDLVIYKTGILDEIRSIATFLLAAFAFVMLAVLTSFKDIGDYWGTIGILALAAVQLIAVHLINIITKKRRIAAITHAKEFTFDSNNQMAIKGFEYSFPQEITEPEPETVETVEVNANDVLDDAAQISIDDIIQENTADEETAATDSLADEKKNIAADDHRDAAAHEPSEKPFNFEQARYDGRFNREYSDYTSRQEQIRRREERPDEYADYRRQSPYREPYNPGYASPYYYKNVQYTHDNFFENLSPEEQHEFDKLFISRVYGDNKRLPMYRIGGDNKEFFTKVFVFIGRYRNVISDNLLEKIYNQTTFLK